MPGSGGSARCVPEEQLREWQRERGPNPSHLNDHPSYPQGARAQPTAGFGGCIEGLLAFRATAAFANKNHGRRLKGYEKWNIIVFEGLTETVKKHNQMGLYSDNKL